MGGKKNRSNNQKKAVAKPPKAANQEPKMPVNQQKKKRGKGGVPAEIPAAHSPVRNDDLESDHEDVQSGEEEDTSIATAIVSTGEPLALPIETKQAADSQFVHEQSASPSHPFDLEEELLGKNGHNTGEITAEDVTQLMESELLGSPTGDNTNPNPLKSPIRDKKEDKATLIGIQNPIVPPITSKDTASQSDLVGILEYPEAFAQLKQEMEANYKRQIVEMQESMKKELHAMEQRLLHSLGSGIKRGFQGSLKTQFKKVASSSSVHKIHNEIRKVQGHLVQQPGLETIKTATSEMKDIYNMYKHYFARKEAVLNEHIGDCSTCSHSSLSRQHKVSDKKLRSTCSDGSADLREMAELGELEGLHRSVTSAQTKERSSLEASTTGKIVTHKTTKKGACIICGSKDHLALKCKDRKPASTLRQLFDEKKLCYACGKPTDDKHVKICTASMCSWQQCSNKYGKGNRRERLHHPVMCLERVDNWVTSEASPEATKDDASIEPQAKRQKSEEKAESTSDSTTPPTVEKKNAEKVVETTATVLSASRPSEKSELAQTVVTSYAPLNIPLPPKRNIQQVADVFKDDDDEKKKRTPPSLFSKPFDT